MKTCYKCEEEKDVSNFSKDKQKKDGLRSSCKSCTLKTRKKRKIGNDPTIKKECSVCKVSFPATLEYFKEVKDMSLGADSQCRSCRSNTIIKNVKEPIEDEDTIKTCTKCNKEYPSTTRYFRAKKQNKDGMMSSCKGCNSKLGSDKWRPLPEPSSDEFKVCSMCELEFPKNTDYFHKKGTGLDSRCVACKSESRQVIDIPGSNGQFKECTKCKVHKEANLDNFAKNKYGVFGLRSKCRPCNEEYIIDTDDSIKKSRRKHYENNKLQYRISSTKRRKTLQKLPRTLTPEEYEENIEYFSHRCAYCSTKLNDDNHHIDHVNPISKFNDGHTKENCIPSCSTCNMNKGARIMEEWYRTKEFFSEEQLNKIYQLTKRGDKD